MGIRSSKHQHRLQHQQISFRSRHNRGGHMGIHSIHGGHNRGGVHIHSIHRGHQHQPLAQHQQISCHSSNRGGHIRNRKRMGIRSKHQHRLQHQQISFRSRHNRGGHMGIHSIHGGHNQGDVHSHSSHREHQH